MTCGDGNDDEPSIAVVGVKVCVGGEMDGGENMGGVDDIMGVD